MDNQKNTGLEPSEHIDDIIEIEVSDTSKNFKETKKAKKLNIKIIIAGAVLFLLLLIVSVPAVNNSIAKAFMSPQNYYIRIEKHFLNKNVKKLDNIYNSVKELYKNYETTSYKSGISVALNKDYADEIKLSTIQNIGFDCDFGNTETLGQSTIKLNLNDSKILTVNQIVNHENGDTYVKIPELTDNFALITKEYLDKNTNNKLFIKEILSDNSITSIRIISLINKYLKNLYSGSADVMLENNVISKVSDINCKYTVITVKFTEEEIQALSETLVTQMKNDTDMKEILISSGVSDEDTYEEMINEAVSDFSQMKTFTMKLWVDINGNVAGREFSSDTMDIGYLTAKNSEKYSINIWHKLSSKETNINFDMENKKNEISGKGLLSINKGTKNSDFEFSVNDLKLISKTKGYVNGKVSVFIPKSEIQINADLDGTSKGQENDIEVFHEDENILNIKAYIYQTEKASNIAAVLPEKNVYDIETDMKGYAEDIDFMGFLTILGGKIDISSVFSDFYSFNSSRNDDEVFNVYNNYDNEFDEEEANYADLTNCKVSINKLLLGFPTTTDDFAEALNIKGTIEGNNYKYFINDERSVQICVYNYTQDTIDAVDGEISLLHVSGNEGKAVYDININDIGIGDGESEITESLGFPTYKEKYDETTHYVYSDVKNGIEFQFYVKAGIITDIIYSVK